MAEGRRKKDPAARHREVTDYVMRVGTASAQTLADQFGVSLVTAHRDIDELTRQGVVRKFHGGVSALPSSVFESNVTYRRKLAVEQKQAIAQSAAALVEPGMSVLLDDSTTTLALAEVLVEVDPLTVITNFQPIIQLMMGRKNIRLIALGGEYNALHDSFIGAPCVESARALHADIGFYSFAGVTADGVYHQEQEIVFTKQAMLAVTTHRILLVDHLKLGRTALHRITGLVDFERVITNEDAPHDALEMLARKHLPVTLAPAST